LVKAAVSVAREKLVSIGRCFGKFSKTGKFRLHITALDILSRYAINKVWIKPTVEQSFLYGNHVLKSGLGRITEDTEKFDGVVIFNMSDLPLGFGRAGRSTAECRYVSSGDIVAINQADLGEYLRDEEVI
jgi:60S ribosome subunit biogenesis protein NIP7